MDRVIAANREPFNLRRGVSKPYDLHYSSNECETIIGSNRFATRDPGGGTFTISLVIDGMPMVGFILSDSHPLLNLQLFDDCNNPLLRINQMS
jgi:trigger factor